MILQMGKQRLERGSDLASVMQPVSGRSKPIATQRVGPTWHLCLPASHFEQAGSQQSRLEGRGPRLLCTHIWASGQGDIGVPAPELGLCLPTSRQLPLQPPSQGLKGPAPAGSPIH